MPGITTAFAQGLLANRPAAAAANAGFMYFSTDSGVLAQSTGSAWVALGFANPLTTQDDLIVGGAAGAPARLGKGTDGQVLTVDPTTHHLVWATPASGGLSDPTTTKGDLIAHGATTTRLPVGTDAQVLTADSTQTLGLKWAAVGAATLATVSSALSANVTMTNANQYYDGPAVSCSAGTWLLIGSILLTPASVGSDMTAKLWDGTTVLSSGELPREATWTYPGTITLAGIATPGSTTTYTISGCGDDAGGTIRASCFTNAAGNTASYLVAIKVA